MENKIKNVMTSVFGIDLSEINHDSSPDSIENWDSLSHMNLVVSLEEKFNIEFEVEEISKMMNLKSIMLIVSGHIK